MAGTGAAHGAQPSHRLWSLPSSTSGWWAFGLTLAIFPIASVLMSHLIPWPILDTALSPVMLVTLIDAAAVTGLVAVIRARERSALTILSVIVAVPLALFGTMMLVLEAIFPH